MNYLDILIVAVIALACGLGFVTGFVWQVAGLASLAVGATCALLFGKMVGTIIGEWLSTPRFGFLIAYISIFTLVSMTIRIVATVLSHYLKKFKLKKFDRALGGLTGFIKGAVICIVIVACISRFGSDKARAKAQDSTLVGVVVSVTDWLLGQPQVRNWSDQAKEGFKKLRETSDGVSAKIIPGDKPANSPGENSEAVETAPPPAESPGGK